MSSPVFLYTGRQTDRQTDRQAGQDRYAVCQQNTVWHPICSFFHANGIHQSGSLDRDSCLLCYINGCSRFAHSTSTLRPRPQHTIYVFPTLVHCWFSVVHGGPTVNQRWVSVSCLLHGTLLLNRINATAVSFRCRSNVVDVASASQQHRGNTLFYMFKSLPNHICTALFQHWASAFYIGRALDQRQINKAGGLVDEMENIIYTCGGARLCLMSIKCFLWGLHNFSAWIPGMCMR